MKSPTPEQIKQTRLAAEHSLAKAARLVCCSKSAWTKWESGHRTMPAGLWLLYVFQTRYPFIYHSLMPLEEDPQVKSRRGRPRKTPGE